MRIAPKNRRLGVFLSGRGSNFEAIADSIAAGRLAAEIAVVIGNVENAPGLARARELGLQAVFIPSAKRPREDFDADALRVLREYDVGLVVLAGFMRIFSPLMLDAYPNRILNIHPSLLPAFPGRAVQEQALAYGVKVSGCTVHLVDGVLDGGPIVLQAAVPVLDSDDAGSLAARILRAEHETYWKAIDLMLSGECRIENRRVLRDSPLRDSPSRDSDGGRR